MDKPASKKELLKSIKAERKNLENSLKSISDNDMLKTGTPGEWSLQDIMAHVTAWEQKLLGWYEAGLRGEKQTMPDWSQPGLVDSMNLDIYRRNHDHWLKEVRKEFKESYKQILKTVKRIPEEEMFFPGRFDWTGKESLADYINANTGRHYAEHIPMIAAIKQKFSL
jgi:hypothetical protein